MRNPILRIPRENCHLFGRMFVKCFRSQSLLYTFAIAAIDFRPLQYIGKTRTPPWKHPIREPHRFNIMDVRSSHAIAARGRGWRKRNNIYFFFCILARIPPRWQRHRDQDKKSPSYEGKLFINMCCAQDNFLDLLESMRSELDFSFPKEFRDRGARWHRMAQSLWTESCTIPTVGPVQPSCFVRGRYRRILRIRGRVKNEDLTLQTRLSTK